MQQTTISKKTLYKDNHTKILKLKLKKPNGDIFTQIQMEKRPFVIIVPIDKQRRILLGQEHRSNLQKKVWMVPTGFIDAKESPKQAAKRELLEETGLLAKKLTPLYQLTGSSEYRQQGFAFLATDLTKADTTPELKMVQTSFCQAIQMALKNKLGDRIGLAVIAAIEKYREKSLHQ